jgi:hypothetical protein
MKALTIIPASGGDLLSAFGHQRGHLRPDVRGNGHHLVGGGHLQVQLDLDQPGHSAQVVVVDVPAVLAEVSGDGVGPPEVGLYRRPRRVRLPGPPGLSDGRDVVDVHTQFDHAVQA